MCVDGDRVSLSQSVSELAEDAEDGVLFFDVFSSCSGGGRAKKNKQLKLTLDELFQMAQSYRDNLPDNARF